MCYCQMRSDYPERIIYYLLPSNDNSANLLVCKIFMSTGFFSIEPLPMDFRNDPLLEALVVKLACRQRSENNCWCMANSFATSMPEHDVNLRCIQELPGKTAQKPWKSAPTLPDHLCKTSGGN